MQTQPLVSIIMPVYNVEKYLPECIQSVLDQTYSNFELLAVDDGSPDRCPEIIDNYAKKDKRVVAIHQENGGVDAARNHGLDVASGKYIAFLDSDDAYEKDYLDILVNCAENSNSELVTCSFIPFGVDSLPKFKLIPAQEADRNTAAKYLLGYNSFNGYVWNKLFRKSIIDVHNLRFEDGYWACDDVLFAGNYLYHCNTVKILETPLYRYRQNNSGANRVRYSGKNKFDKKWMSSFKVMSYFKKLYGVPEVTTACNLHEVREAGIVLRSMAACDYHGPEYEKMRNIIRKYGREFYKSQESSYFQKLSVWLTSVSPKLELAVWKIRNKG